MTERSPALRAVACGALAAVLGCSDPRLPEADGSRRGGTLRIDAPQLRHLRSLDPIEVTDINSSSVGEAIYEGLLGYDPRQVGRFAPALAESWQVSEDGTEWTFRMRRGVVFHDDPCFENGRGRAVRAEDVLHSMRRSLRHGRHPGLIALREGPEPHVEVLPGERIRFRLARKSNAFPHALAAAVGWVVPREAVDRYGPHLSRHPVGSGPFRLASWNTEELVLVRHERYWKTDAEGRGLPYLDSVVMTRDRIPAVERVPFSRLMEGDLHLLYFTGELGLADFDGLAPLLERRGIRLVATPKLNTIFYGWNLERDDTWSRNRELRRAVAAAVRRPDPGELLHPAEGLLPPGLSECVPGPVQATDLELARELLRRAGFPGGSGLPPLEASILGRTRLVERSLLVPLERLGVAVDVRTLPRDVHWAALDRGESAFFRDGWIADYPDPENFFWLFASGSPVNHTRYSDAEYDELFGRLRALPAGSPERAALCRRLQEILHRDCPAVFLYHEKSIYLVRREVHGIEASVNPFERKFYEYVWLDPAGR